MIQRTRLRVVSFARGAPITSFLLVGLLGAVLAATAIAATEQGGGPITAVKVVRVGNEFASVSSSGFVDVPGASTSITVPSGQRALIVARFSAQSTCYRGPTTPCIGSVRILIGGVEGAPGPAAGGGFYFDETQVPNEVQSSAHSMERSRGGLGGLPAGTYPVKVQFEATNGSNTTFDLGAWHLTVETSRTS